MRKRILPLVAALLLLCLSVTAAAHDVPDLNKTGSVTITMRRGDTVISGGTLSLIPVGEIAEDDGNYFFAPLEPYAELADDFDDLSDPLLAARIADIATYQRGITLAVDQDGKVIFGNVEPGLYLVMQKKAADGWSCISPFLISVPNMQDGVYVYDVDASPKIELKPTERPPETPPNTPPEPPLPQTGQLNWPIPLMAAAGRCLLLLGSVLRRSAKRADG